ncbi:MAG: polymer-forming cytoskeletal protein [Candidatus Bathyarchaeota archaeon]|nr:MAG: polymer-forming cytoskeletal protein [Candidatus Bathyarchaeota archaeon]
MTEIAALPQKIVDRRIIVLKSRLDPTMARLLGEKVKDRFFTRLRFFKPKPEMIRLISVDKYYEPYVVVGGKYSIDYCKKHVYSVSVDKNAREVALFDKKFVPEPSSQLPHGAQVIKMDGVAYFHYEDEASLALDKIGRKIDPEQLPCAPSEERTVEELARVGIKFAEVKISLEEEIEFLSSRIANRPSDVGEVIREMFEVNERTLIYFPMYQLAFRNVKTGKEAIARIDGITGKTVLGEFSKTVSEEFMRDLSVSEGPEEIARDPKNKTIGLPEGSRALEIGGKTKSPSKVAKTFLIGAKATTVAGDVEIPSGTTVRKTLKIEGHLKIGSDCRILGKVKALGDIMIGANTTIEGDVVSGGKVVIGLDSVIHGSLESAEHVEIGENAVIKGGLYSESSIVLDRFARVYGRE